MASQEYSIGEKESRVADTGVHELSQDLRGLKVALGVCGSIAAVESVKIARELRRHGGSVAGFLTPGAEQFITPLALAWACDLRVITGADPAMAHLEPWDAIVIAPLSFHTMRQLSLGLVGNNVALLFAAQVGRKIPLVCAPALNNLFLTHPQWASTYAELEKWGVAWVVQEEEGRLKMPPANKIVEVLVRQLKDKNPREGKP